MENSSLGSNELVKERETDVYMNLQEMEKEMIESLKVGRETWGGGKVPFSFFLPPFIKRC